MRKVPWGLVWLVVAVAGLGIFAYSLGLDRSDALASIGSFVIALAALVAAARTYLQPGSGQPAPTGEKYRQTIHGNVGLNLTGDNPTAVFHRRDRDDEAPR